MNTFRIAKSLPEGVQRCLGDALKAGLERWGFIEGNETATVQIQGHEFEGIHRSARDVTACPYDQAVRLVILLRPITFRTVNRSVPDWAKSDDRELRVLCLDPVPGIFETLDAMLERVLQENPNASSK